MLLDPNWTQVLGRFFPHDRAQPVSDMSTKHHDPARANILRANERELCGWSAVRTTIGWTHKAISSTCTSITLPDVPRGPPWTMRRSTSFSGTASAGPSTIHLLPYDALFERGRPPVPRP